MNYKEFSTKCSITGVITFIIAQVLNDSGYITQNSTALLIGFSVIAMLMGVILGIMGLRSFAGVMAIIIAGLGIGYLAHLLASDDHRPPTPQFIHDGLDLVEKGIEKLAPGEPEAPQIEGTPTETTAPAIKIPAPHPWEGLTPAPNLRIESPVAPERETTSGLYLKT